MLEQGPWPSEKLPRNWGGQRSTDVPCDGRAGCGKMRCCNARACNVRGRKSTCTGTKVSAAAPEGGSAARSGYHRGRREAHQKN